MCCAARPGHMPCTPYLTRDVLCCGVTVYQRTRESVPESPLTDSHRQPEAQTNSQCNQHPPGFNPPKSEERCRPRLVPSKWAPLWAGHPISASEPPPCYGDRTQQACPLNAGVPELMGQPLNGDIRTVSSKTLPCLEGKHGSLWNFR